MSVAETSTHLRDGSSHLEQLFRQYQQKLIKRLAGIVRDEDAAADLTQESYLRLASIPAAQRIIHPRAFLFRTALNLALDYVRRQKTRRVAACSLDLIGVLPIPQPAPEQTVLDRQRFARFRHALMDLSPRCREVFILHKVEGLSYGEIGARLGISQSAVEKHIMRALAHCRRAVQE